MNLNELRGVKQRDLKPCMVCGQGLARDGNLISFRVRIARTMVNVRAVQSQVGLEMMLGGGRAAGAVAAALGPDEDMLKELPEVLEGFVCMDCAVRHGLAQFEEKANVVRR